MNHLKIIQKLGQGIAYRFVNSFRAQAAADDHNDRLVGCEFAHIIGCDFIAFRQFFPDRGACEDSFPFGEHRNGFREIAAYFFRYGYAQLVGQSRRHIRLVDNAGNGQGSGGPNDGNADKTAFGKNDVRLDLFQIFSGFPVALHYAEGVGEILRVKIPAEFAGSNTVVRNVEIRNQFFLNAFVGTYIVYLIT